MFDANTFAALVTLTLLEIILGIDNIIFLSILVSRLPAEQRPQGRIIGLALAMLTRLGLLFSLTWIMKLNTPLLTLGGVDITGRALILFGGGLFLLAKSTHEIHQEMESIERKNDSHQPKIKPSFWWIVIQIAILDIVFSLDSVITAVGLVNQLPIMVAAIVIAMFVMMLSAKSINQFIEKHPTIKMLALSFLILIGMALIADALSFHIPKGYLYFAMAFSLSVEFLNIRLHEKKRRAGHHD